MSIHDDEQIRTIIKRLQEENGSEMLTFNAPGVDKIICFPNTGYKILCRNWYDANKSDPIEERLRVVLEAKIFAQHRTT